MEGKKLFCELTLSLEAISLRRSTLERIKSEPSALRMLSGFLRKL